MKTIFCTAALAFTALPAISSPNPEESESPTAQIAELHAKLVVGKQTDLAGVSKEFEKAVTAASLSPSPRIREEAISLQDTSTKLLDSLAGGKFAKESPETKSIASAVRATLIKLDSSIDENYKHQLGTANVRPPAGTPNASAGMNPDAISDPKLRQQYLDAIESEKIKQQTNSQQQELRTARRRVLQRVAALNPWREAAGISKEELIEQFSAKGKSRDLLREMISLPRTSP